MLVQETHAAEGLLAARAGVLLGLEVSLEVRAKVGLVGKAPGAVVAGKRFLSSVNPFIAKINQFQSIQKLTYT